MGPKNTSLPFLLFSSSSSPRTRLSLLNPELINRLKTESRHSTFARSRSTLREFTAGDYVRVKGTRPGDPLWLAGTITRRISAVTCTVRVDNEERFVHADHIVSAKRPDYRPARSSHSVLQLPGRLDEADPMAAREMAAVPDRQQGDDEALQDQSSHERPASGRLKDGQAISGSESLE
ncbi:hypothetical protein HPB49_001037 [Dermacentor silvarum]|uniref:Uncharacterized protein n=1 Tax=Dermacentor silvarum TaxID=543639 RepID=A0ACB8D9H9_DERSI|nr:hypothetical protein HPB49_001037 [Dermacentor silvarum]